MRNEKQRNGVKILITAGDDHLSRIEFFVNKERRIRYKTIHLFECRVLFF